MDVCFSDTSALAKRYVTEAGSNWVRSWIEPAAGNITIVSELTSVEVVSVFMRKHRAGFLTMTQVSSLEADYLHHASNEYLVVQFETSIMDEARRLLQSYKLRALDAIQLASAKYAYSLLSLPVTFICGDNDLLAAATSEGFPTDNPLNHP